MASRMDNWVQNTARFYAWRDWAGDGPGSVAALIAENPVSIVVQRAAPGNTNTALAAQTVRIDLDTSMMARDMLGRGASSSLTNKQKVIITGYLNNPIVADTDLQAFDRFQYSGKHYTVRKVDVTLSDRLLAEADADG